MRPSPKAFVRSMAGASAEDVVKAARRRGLAIELPYVKSIRSMDELRSAPLGRARSEPSHPVSTNRPRDSTRRSPKRTAILDVGLDKPTKEIVAALWARGLLVSRKYVDHLRDRARRGDRLGARS